MNDLQIFNFESHSIRTVVIDSAPWWVAKDVAEALGYTDPTMAVRSHCKGVSKLHPLQTPGGTQEARIIDESDLYRMIFGSTLPEAQRFEKWVVEEVLPTIRRTGTYSTDPVPPSDQARANLVNALRLAADSGYITGIDVRVLLGLMERRQPVKSAKQYPRMNYESVMERVSRIPWWPCSLRTFALYTGLSYAWPREHMAKMGMKTSQGINREQAGKIVREVFKNRDGDVTLRNLRAEHRTFMREVKKLSQDN